MQLGRADDGVWEGTTGTLRLRWSGLPGNAAIEIDGEGAEYLERGREPGEHQDLVLEIAGTHLDGPPPDPDRAWELTEEAWRRSVASAADSLAPREVQHSWAVLRGLTSRGGAMVAAATTSQPSRAEQGRDPDYRYAWIRDQCFAGQAVAAAGGGELLKSAVWFVRDRLLARGAPGAGAHHRRRPGARPTLSGPAPLPGGMRGC
jgi:hypothetical protein